MSNDNIYIFIILVVLAIPLLSLISDIIIHWKGTQSKNIAELLRQFWQNFSMIKVLGLFFFIAVLGILGYFILVLLFLYDYRYMVQHLDAVIKALTDQDNLIFAAVICVVFFLGIILSICNKLENLRSFLPSLAVSIGIFGTFWGIFIGLSEFDTYNISGSIPFLLNGMKTAFVTSIIGMLASILLRVIYAILTDVKEKSTTSIVSDIIQGLQDIIKSNQDIQKQAIISNRHLETIFQITIKSNDFIQNKLESLEQNLVQNNTEFKNFSANLSSSTANVLTYELQNLIEKFNHNLADLVGESFKNLTESTQRLVTWQENFQVIIQSDAQNLTNLLKHIQALNQYYDNSLRQFKEANDVLHNLAQTIELLQIDNQALTQHTQQLLQQNQLLDATLQSVHETGKVLTDLAKQLANNSTFTPIEQNSLRKGKHDDEPLISI